ncbi:MAG: hypothetical protein ACRD0P_20785, partial [Stackebrandtia sp.]
RVQREIRRRVLEPFLDEPRSRWWETSTNNWAAVCAGAVGMAGLALEDDRLRLAALIDRVQRTMASFLSGFGTDGGCVEGLDYWVYGYGYFTYYAEALRDRTGLDLLSGTESIAAFPAAVDLGGGRCVSFSDGGDRVVPPTGLMSRLRDRLDAPLPQLTRLSSFEDDHCYRWAHLTRTLLWTDTSVIGQRAPRGTAWLPDLAWFVDRCDIDGVPVTVAAKGGHNDEPHNHLDLGGFILALDGEQVLADLGSGVYDADYFGRKRYEALHTSAAGHSIPSIAGRDQEPGRDSEAVVEEFLDQADRVRLALDLSAAYGGTGFRRVIDWDRRGVLVVSDRFTESGRELEERFISRIEPTVTAEHITWSAPAGAVNLRLDTQWTPQIDRIETHDHHGKPETVYRLRLQGTTHARRGFEFTIKPGLGRARNRRVAGVARCSASSTDSGFDTFSVFTISVYRRQGRFIGLNRLASGEGGVAVPKWWTEKVRRAVMVTVAVSTILAAITAVVIGDGDDNEGEPEGAKVIRPDGAAACDVVKLDAPDPDSPALPKGVSPAGEYVIADPTGTSGLPGLWRNGKPLGIEGLDKKLSHVVSDVTDSGAVVGTTTKRGEDETVLGWRYEDGRIRELSENWATPTSIEAGGTIIGERSDCEL